MYSRKQNQDPNRSTMISSKPSCDKKSHNQSLQMVSQSVYQNNKKRQGQQFINQNSVILAQMRQSKLLNSKSSNLTKRQGQSNIGSRQPSQSTTQRSSYKPRFIIKDMLEQQENESQKHLSVEQSSEMNTIVTNSESMCEQYKKRPYEGQSEQESNVSGTFNNSPLRQLNENYYRFVKRGEENGKGVGGKNNSKNDSFSRGNRSVVVVGGGKKSFAEDQVTKRVGKQSFVDDEDVRMVQAKALMREQEQRQSRVKLVNKGNINKERNQTRIKRISQCTNENIHPNNNLKRIPTQQSSQLHQQSPDQTSPQDTFYEQSSTVQYPLPKSPMTPLFQTRVRCISTASNDPCKSITTQKDYKVEYLQTKKLLDVRSAYFTEAMELCKHVMGNMKEVLAQELKRKQKYGESENDNGIEWCYERCQDMIEALDSYSSKANI